LLVPLSSADILEPPLLQLARSLTGKKTVSSVALCAGSGGGFLKGVTADVIWTGEMSHHEILAYVAAGSHVILCEILFP